MSFFLVAGRAVGALGKPNGHKNYHIDKPNVLVSSLWTGIVRIASLAIQMGHLLPTNNLYIIITALSWTL